MNSEPSKIKVIVKVETERNNLCLLFPEEECHDCCINHWNELTGKGEVSLSYYWSLRNPREEAVSVFIKKYEDKYNVQCERVYRDSLDMKKKRYSKSRYAHLSVY